VQIDLLCITRIPLFATPAIAIQGTERLPAATKKNAAEGNAPLQRAFSPTAAHSAATAWLGPSRNWNAQ
jgi:hypothetical protein